MNYLVDPQSLLFNSLRVDGFAQMTYELKVPNWDLLQIALDTTSEWTSDWPEDQGFGSSDMTYMIQDYIDNILSVFGRGLYQTKFNPRLSVVEYTEADHHERIQRMESGI